MNQSSVNQITDKKPIRTGLSLYKTGRSQYWFAQIWVGAEKKYYRKSTKETSRIDAAKTTELIRGNDCIMRILPTKKFGEISYCRVEFGVGV